MSRVKRYRIEGVVLALSVFAVDQAVKWVVTWPLQLRARGVIELVPFFDLRWTENRGVSMGFLTAESMEMRWLLVALTGLIAAAVFAWMLRERLRGDILALALVLGGAMGNILDRYRFGYVIDYADLHFGSFRPFLVFNIADAAITFGVLILLARAFVLGNKERAGGKPSAMET